MTKRAMLLPIVGAVLGYGAHLLMVSAGGSCGILCNPVLAVLAGAVSGWLFAQGAGGA